MDEPFLLSAVKHLIRHLLGLRPAPVERWRLQIKVAGVRLGVGLVEDLV